MKNLRIRFYKWRKTLFSKLIAWKQGTVFSGRYAGLTHTEIEFEKWQSFSSSEVDWGVRFKTDIDFNNWNWCYIDISVTDRHYKDIYEWCEWHICDEYDWLAIFFVHIFNFNKQKADSWFCSEICYYPLFLFWILHINLASWFVKPGKLAYELEKKWYKIIWL